MGAVGDFQLNRRDTLRGICGLVTVCGIAGCQTDRETPETTNNLSVVDTFGDAKESAVIDVYVRVGNTGTIRESDRLTVELTIFGEDTYRKSRSISVDPGANETYQFSFNISQREAQWAGNYRYRAWLEAQT